MVLLENKLDLIGNTPTVKLDRIFNENQANVYAKLESYNLTGSMKARSALGMIEAAEERGDLKPGMTIIESTSGNLGYALGAIGAIKGYDVILVVDPKTDDLKKNMLKAYGADLIVVPNPDEHGAYQPVRIQKVKDLLKEVPNSWWPEQYYSIDNLMAHYKSTGPEIYEDLSGKVDYLIGAVGTCGHLAGSAKYLKEKNPDLIVIGVEPEGSVISGGSFKPYIVQGPGLSFVPDNYTYGYIDEVVKIADEDALYAARELAQKEAILSGGSAGSVIHVIKKVIEKIPADANIAAILADDGFRYAGNFYDDNWLVGHGLKPYGDNK